MKQGISKNISDEELILAYNELKHLGKMANRLKLPQIQVWRRCQKLDLHFKNGGKQIAIPLNEILVGMHGYYPTNKLSKRLQKDKIIKYECTECGLSDIWNNKSIVLQLDHKDGDNSNHKLENLRFLCPNCHSQTNTYCGRNK